MWGYRKRLTSDLARWKANGWLTSDGEAGIARELAATGREFSLATALGILASVLLGFAVMSFVAAHWSEIPRGLRLAMLAGLMWGGYAAAGYFADSGARGLADASIVFAVAVFGASIMLISQMFHIEGYAPDAVAFWAAGALLSGVLLRSNAALAFAMLLVVVWWGMDVSERVVVNWPFLIGWSAVTAAFIWQRWQPGVHLSGLALTMFVIALGFLLNKGQAHSIVVALGLLAAAVAIAIERFYPAWRGSSEAALGYAMATAFVGLMGLQFFENRTTASLILIAALMLVLLLGAIAYGVSQERKSIVWLGYIGFSIEIMALYVHTIGTILDTSLFFLIAGVIVALLAGFAWRLSRQSGDKPDANQAVSP
ncbi:MAG: hypothetical protein CTY31_13025 [Hyphomicrobium sp.]|nr:MAG: hypothetical protein CTY31_13025 [Hyphomicrobium sp.]